MITLKRILVTALAAALLCTATPGTAHAAEGEWEYTLVPYAWLAGIDGEVAVGRQTFEPSLSFGDIFENLDFGAMLHFQAKKGRLGLFIDPTYINLGSERTVGSVEAELDVTMWLVEFGALYELWADNAGMSIDVLGGGRYLSLENEIEVPGIAAVSDTKSGIDPLVGARFMADLTSSVPLLVRGDIGGFGVNTEFSWQLIALLGYRFSPTMTLWGGYRALDLDVEEGERDALFEAKVNLNGPILGLAFQF
jgi:opacity protein-like surface antigen